MRHIMLSSWKADSIHLPKKVAFFLLGITFLFSSLSTFAAEESSELVLGGQVRSEKSPVRRFSPFFLKGNIDIRNHEYFQETAVNFEIDARHYENNKSEPKAAYDAPYDTNQLYYLNEAKIVSLPLLQKSTVIEAGRFTNTDLGQYLVVDGIKVKYNFNPRFSLIPSAGVIHTPEDNLITNESIPWGSLALRYQTDEMTFLNALQAKHPREGLPIYLFDQAYTHRFGENRNASSIYYFVEASQDNARLNRGELGLNQPFAESYLGGLGYRYVSEVTTAYDRRQELFANLNHHPVQQVFAKLIETKSNVGLQAGRAASDVKEEYYLADVWWQDFLTIGPMGALSLQLGTIDAKSDDYVRYLSIALRRLAASAEWQTKYEVDSVHKTHSTSSYAHSFEVSGKKKLGESIAMSLALLEETNVDAAADFSVVMTLGYMGLR